MKRIILLSLTAATVLVLAQCSPKTVENTASSKPPITVPANDPKEFTPTEIAQGAVIYQGSCGRCHKLFSPEAFTLKQWNRILPEMYHKAKLDETKSALVSAYVLPKAKKG